VFDVLSTFFLSFKVDGPGVVHLTGNLIIDDEPNFDGDMWSDDSDGGSETEMTEADTPETKSKKRKNGEAKKSADAKKIKLDSSNGKADDEESSDDDSDDDETEGDTTTGADTTNGGDTTTLSDLDSTANFAEEEDSDSGEEEESDDDDESEEEAPAAAPPKQNGDVSPTKKAKLEAKNKTPSKPETENKKPKTPKVEVTPKADKASKEDKSTKPDATPKAGKTPKPEATPKGDKNGEKTPKPATTPKPEQTPKDKKNVEKTPKPDATKTPKSDKTPKPEAPKTPKDPKAATEAKTPKSAKKVMKGGIQIEDILVGKGPEVQAGKKIGMYYKGCLQKNGKQFDSCLKGKPFKFRLGAGEVIKGWDVGISGMKVGGKRKLTIPPNMAYGAQGAMPDIPPNSTLVFDIECKFST
jgi:FK506-binding nuclear protein